MRSFFLALSSAILLTLSFPKFDLEFLVWIALVPLLIVIKKKSAPSAFCFSFLTGVASFMGIFYWINVIKGFTLVDFLLLGIYLGSYVGLFGLLFSFVSKRGVSISFLTAPVLWVSLEYLRSQVSFLSLPWGLLGHAQYLNIPLIQISAFTGAYGVSFLILVVNVIVSDIILYYLHENGGNINNRGSLFKKTVTITFCLIFVVAYGYYVISEQHGEDGPTITVIQGNIPQSIKWDQEFLNQNMDKHVLLTQKASQGSNASLIVWPESSVQGRISNLYFLKTLSGLAQETGKYLLVGSSQQPKFGSKDFQMKNLFNTASLISPKGYVINQYNKIRLLPFAEYLPYKNTLPWPSRFISNADNYIQGKDYSIFNINGTRFGVMICWENIFPEVFRRFVKGGAKFMVNITNEGWFQETAAPYQFVAMSVFRAAENHVTVIRSANTGVSCFIDPFGRIVGKVSKGGKDIFVEGYLTMPVSLSDKKTFYTLYGDVFAYINLVLALLFMIISFAKTLSRRRDISKTV